MANFLPLGSLNLASSAETIGDLEWDSRINLQSRFFSGNLGDSSAFSYSQKWQKFTMKYQAKIFPAIALLLGSFASPVLGETVARSPSEFHPQQLNLESSKFPSIVPHATDSENAPSPPDRGDGRR